MEAMNAAVNVPNYAAVLSKHPPRVIHTEAENEYYTTILHDLDERFDQLSDAEKDYAELLALLIEDFESKHYELPEASPLEVIRFLMDQHHLKQKDLLDIFGNASITSEVLSGKRELSKEHIRKLVTRFSIPAELLL
jgi:HTH-type transcriptional regulator / antitoxin HigA